MSTSYIEYRGHGFWSFDRNTEGLISSLADRLERHGGEAWTLALAEHWRRQASGVFSAWMSLMLDEFLIDEGRRRRLCEMLDEELVETQANDPIHKTGMLLSKLLNGEIDWAASTPLTYMVDERPTGA